MAIRGRARVPLSAAGRGGGSLPLRLPLRRRESGGTRLPRPWCVEGRRSVSRGAGVWGSAAARWSFCVGAWSPSRRRLEASASSGCWCVHRVCLGGSPAGGAVVGGVLSGWSLVLLLFLLCVDGLGALGGEQLAVGARGSVGPVGGSISGCGHRAGGGGHAVELLSPGFFSATARSAPSSSWSLGGQRGRWSWPRSPLSLQDGDGGDGGPDSCLTQGWCCDGGRSGFAGSRIESSVADGRFIVLGSGGFVGRLLISKAWWCSLLWVLWRFPFFFSGVAGDGGSKLVWWFSIFFVAVASVLCIQGCTPAYVIHIVLLSL